jgi:hypothetical protein
MTEFISNERKFEGQGTEMVRMRFAKEKKESNELEKTKIALVLGDAGSLAYALPMFEELRKKYHVELFVDSEGVAKKALERDGIAVPDSSVENSITGAQLVLIGTSGKATRAWRRATEEAKRQNIPCLWFGDFFGSGSESQLKDLAPDWAALFDESSRDLFKTRHPDVADGRIAVVGNPAFDRVAREGIELERAQMRGALKIQEGERLIVYSASSMAQFDLEKSLRPLLSWVRDHGVKFAIAFHPADMATMPQRVNELQEKIRDSLASPERFVSTEGYTTSQLTSAADLVVTDYSTSGVHSAIAGVPTVFFMPDDGPNSAQAYQRSRGGERPYFPILENGGPAIGIFDEESVSRLGDAIAMKYRGMIRDAWQDPRYKVLADGEAGKRFIDFVEHVVSRT